MKFWKMFVLLGLCSLHEHRVRLRWTQSWCTYVWGELCTVYVCVWGVNIMFYGSHMEKKAQILSDSIPDGVP